ncbi:M23 family metallopeptidase [Mesorhizobium koreense]|uniref:M23 family metallopeptidase n=1 Tax=Mesorhizobium koreense TaxID=3074855 RepID=UPI0035303121
MESVAHPPQSTVFGKRSEPHTVIIARGDTIRHFTIRPWVAAVAGSACAAIAIGYLLATSYLVLRDNLIGASVSHQARMQQAYEDRISALRSQVDRITSRQLLDQRAVEQKVSELLARQSLLSQQHGRLGPLLERAETLEKAASIPLPSVRPDKRARADEGSSTSNAQAVGLRTAEIGPAALWKTRLASTGDETTTDRADRLFASINTSLRSIETEQLRRVQTLSQKAWQTGDAVKEALQSAGLEVAANYGKEDVGGPLIEVNDPTKFDKKVKELDQALDRLDLLKAEIRKIPIANPAPGAVVTSAFGVRRDPILGVSALHPGIDFRDAIGSNVPATAAGVVTRASRAGGYGNMVEIDHGGGYSTRYAHLSEIDVKVGDKVARGETIGKSGSTGRSTGPHLHYEVRHNGKAVDPVSFLKAGRVISQLL